MKKSKLLIVLIMCLLVSCAHKSGHKRLNRSAVSATERESVRTPDSEDNVTPATAEYGDNNEILNGKTIFNRYEKPCSWSLLQMVQIPIKVPAFS